ncbi:MAG: signal peptidase I [Candidatus Omnitrophota bacterium]
MNERIRREVKEWSESLIIALILALLIRAFIVQAFKIPSGSMMPTLKVGDRIFVNKFIYGARIPFTKLRLPNLREPERGDIVVFKSPTEPKKDFIKRLIATGGETVEIRDGDIYIDNAIVRDPRIIKNRYYYNRGEFGDENSATKVPEGSFYVLGDNSDSSRDSRFWGFVPKDSIVGKAILIYWPIPRVRIVK